MVPTTGTMVPHTTWWHWFVVDLPIFLAAGEGCGWWRVKENKLLSEMIEITGATKIRWKLLLSELYGGIHMNRQNSILSVTPAAACHLASGRFGTAPSGRCGGSSPYGFTVRVFLNMSIFRLFSLLQKLEKKRHQFWGFNYWFLKND